MTTVAAVRSAFPPHRYPQAEFKRMVAGLGGLGGAQRALLERLYRNSGVERGIPPCPWPLAWIAPARWGCSVSARAAVTEPGSGREVIRYEH